MEQQQNVLALLNAAVGIRIGAVAIYGVPLNKSRVPHSCPYSAAAKVLNGILIVELLVEDLVIDEDMYVQFLLAFILVKYNK